VAKNMPPRDNQKMKKEPTLKMQEPEPESRSEVNASMKVP